MHYFKILVADDDPEWRELLGLWLSPAGYSLSFATCGKDVVGLAESFRPDCILLDFELGDQTALEICAALRAKAPLDVIPIVILTSHTEEKLHAYRNCQADHFVVKDGRNPDEVLAVLEATFRRVAKERRSIAKGDIRLEPQGCGVWHEGRLVATLSRERFMFFYLLVQRSPDHVAYQDLLKFVLHDHSPQVNTDAVRSLARHVRNALPKPLARRVKNIKGVGWVYRQPAAVPPAQSDIGLPTKN